MRQQIYNFHPGVGINANFHKDKADQLYLLGLIISGMNSRWSDERSAQRSLRQMKIRYKKNTQYSERINVH